MFDLPSASRNDERSNGVLAKSEGLCQTEMLYTGGLTGYLGYGGLVSNCLVSGTNGITGSGAYVGGLIGCCFGTVIKSRAITDVISSSNTGGLIGITQDAFVDRRYAKGNVVSNNRSGGFLGVAYYNSVGRTPAEMKTRSNYIDWDFENVWEMQEGSCPALKRRREHILGRRVLNDKSLYQ